MCGLRGGGALCSLCQIVYVTSPVDASVEKAMSVRVLIADDHEVVRMGLRSMFAGSDVEIVAEAGSGGDRAVSQHL